MGSRLGDITGDAADLELFRESGVVEDGTDDRAALVASGAENSENLGHFELLNVVLVRIKGYVDWMDGIESELIMRLLLKTRSCLYRSMTQP